MASQSNPIRTMAIIFGALIAVTGVSMYMRGNDRVPWRTDINAAIQEADQSRKPLVVYLTATWCGPCQQMRRTTFADRDVEAAMNDFVPVKIDIDQQRDVAVRYARGNGMPQFIMVTPDGRVVRHTEGYLDAETFVKWLQGAVI